MVKLQAIMDLQALWNDYGIVGDVKVCPSTNLTPQVLTVKHNQPFTAHFPRANIHELIAPDLLHQLIKGAFKDHLVTWINKYLESTYSKQQAAEIIAEIDHRLVIV